MKLVPCFVLFCSCLLMSEITKAQDKPMTDKKKSTVKTFHIEASINASVETCWEAWTDVSIAKQWLGTTFSGTKVGDDYRVSTLIPYLSGRHEILAIEKNKSLKLQYFIDGWAAELTVKFENIETGKKQHTKLIIDFTVDTKNSPESIEPLKYAKQNFYFIGQSWSNALRKMRCLLEDSSEGVLVARQNNDHVINLSVEIKAKPEKIFHTLTNAKELQQCWSLEFITHGAAIDAKVGGTYCYGWYPKDTPEKDKQDGPGKILKLEKNKLLIHNWYGGQKQAEITWKLEPVSDEITRVVFKHSPLLSHSTGNVWSYRSGWTDALYSLKWYHERGEVEKDWLISK